MDNTKAEHPVTIRFTQMQLDFIKKSAKDVGGLSVNAYIRYLINKEMKK